MLTQLVHIFSSTPQILLTGTPGGEALKKAKEENKLIIIGIDCSSCHWCHLMAHEALEDSTTAPIMNKHFINIIVYREERPDVDQIYMDAVQKMG